MTRPLKKDPILCAICGVEFLPRLSNQKVCKSEECQKERKRRHHVEWRIKTGRYDPELDTRWTEEELDILRNNRFLSTEEMYSLLDRPKGSIKQKRSQLKLHRLAKCVECGKVHDYINQHETCYECSPSQQEYNRNYKNSIQGRWQMYKANAKKRNLVFELTLTDFETMWQTPCSYCGDDIETIGIDRIDSSKGYEKDNIIPCCGRCNEMKNSATVGDWINHMQKIITHMGHHQ